MRAGYPWCRGPRSRRKSGSHRTRRWREPDSNLYGLFLSSSCFWFVAGCLFGAGKPFLVRSPAIRFAERATHEILRAIGAARHCLVVLSANTVNNPGWVKKEIRAALDFARRQDGSTACDCPRTDAARPALELSGLARARTNWRSLSPRVRIAYRPPSIARHCPRSVIGIDADRPAKWPYYSEAPPSIAISAPVM